MTAIHRLERAASTQDLLHQLAADGAPAGTAVLAAEQRAGRGSRGRLWHSPRGGLWLSVLLRPATPVGMEVLSLRVGVAVAEMLATLPALPPLALKWPNDLMLGDRKAGGILCEARWQGDVLAWVAVGLGLNVTNELPADTAPAAARLADYDPDLTPEMLADPIVRAVSGVDNRGDMLDHAELATFAARDWLRGRALTEPAAGRAIGVARDGALIVRGRNGREIRARSGTVVLAPGGA